LNPKKQRDRVRDELVKFPGMDKGEDHPCDGYLRSL
jgi:hypothetical protein